MAASTAVGKPRIDSPIALSMATGGKLSKHVTVLA